MTNDVPHMPKVALVAYKDVQMSAVLGLGDLFDVANRFANEAKSPTIQWEIVQFDALSRHVGFEAIVLPPNLAVARGGSDIEIHDWINQQHKWGATICSACAGAFWLGHAGVLEGRPATTHWALENEFKQAFPKVRIHPEHLIIDDDDIVTAGGVMAWLDLGIHLIRKFLGPEIVSKTCRQMLIDPAGREQRNYKSFIPNMAHSDDRVREIQRWLAGHIADNLSVARLADRFGWSKRTMQRRFTNATGLPINQYVQHLRVEKAKGLLERTSSTVSEICWQVGYSDVSAFSRVFRAISGLSASEYRKRFAIK